MVKIYLSFGETCCHSPSERRYLYVRNDTEVGSGYVAPRAQ